MKSIINHTKEFEFHFPLRKFHFLKLQVAWKTGFPQRLLGGGRVSSLGRSEGFSQNTYSAFS